MSAKTKQRTRRQVTEEARQAALGGRWQNAMDINRELIQRDAKDTEAHNRLGRALMEIHDYNASYDAYSNALKSDPANLIARRNLRRLELLRGQKGDSPLTDNGTVFPRTSVFLEEVGKTWVTEMTNPVPTSVLAGIYAGQQLTLSIDNGRMVVSTLSGDRVGEIEHRTAERVIELMAAGNVYEVFALGLTAASLRVILREVYKDPRNSVVFLSRARSRKRGHICESGTCFGSATSPISMSMTSMMPKTTCRRSPRPRAKTKKPEKAKRAPAPKLNRSWGRGHRSNLARSTAVIQQVNARRNNPPGVLMCCSDSFDDDENDHHQDQQGAGRHQ